MANNTITQIGKILFFPTSSSKWGLVGQDFMRMTTYASDHSHDVTGLWEVAGGEPGQNPHSHRENSPLPQTGIEPQLTSLNVFLHIQE